MGEKIAASVATFFNDKKNLDLLDVMLKEHNLKISNPDYQGKMKATGLLEGLTFVITGTLPKPRKEVEDLIEAHGGHASSAVSASTDYLVVGEEAGSKLRKAKDLGVKTVSYEGLLKLIEKGDKAPRLF